MTLGYSRKCVRLLTSHSSSRTWNKLHERAFSKLGGAVKIVVLDDLGKVALAPDFYDLAIKPLYCDVLHHYGAVATPRKIADPDRKGQGESGGKSRKFAPCSSPADSGLNYKASRWHSLSVESQRHCSSAFRCLPAGQKSVQLYNLQGTPRCEHIRESKTL